MFIQRVTERQLEAILALRGTSMWQEVSALVDAELKALYGHLRDSHEHVALARAQGSIRALEALQDLFAKAQDNLQKRRKPSSAGTL